MNVNQIVTMVIRMVMRRLLRKGVNAGIDAVGNRMSRGNAAEQQGQSLNTAETTKRAKQAMKIARRMR